MNKAMTTFTQSNSIRKLKSQLWEIKSRFNVVSIIIPYVNKLTLRAGKTISSAYFFAPFSMASSNHFLSVCGMSYSVSSKSVLNFFHHIRSVLFSFGISNPLQSYCLTTFSRFYSKLSKGSAYGSAIISNNLRNLSKRFFLFKIKSFVGFFQLCSKIFSVKTSKLLTAFVRTTNIISMTWFPMRDFITNWTSNFYRHSVTHNTTTI